MGELRLIPVWYIRHSCGALTGPFRTDLDAEEAALSLPGQVRVRRGEMATADGVSGYLVSDTDRLTFGTEATPRSEEPPTPEERERLIAEIDKHECRPGSLVILPDDPATFMAPFDAVPWLKVWWESCGPWVPDDSLTPEVLQVKEQFRAMLGDVRLDPKFWEG